MHANGASDVTILCMSLMFFSLLPVYLQDQFKYLGDGTDGCKVANFECGTGACSIECEGTESTCDEIRFGDTVSGAVSFQCTGSECTTALNNLEKTAEPSQHPTLQPGTQSPTAIPSETPSQEPTLEPTIEPTFVPTDIPTTAPPTKHPTTEDPTRNPTTIQPSTIPTSVPTSDPTSIPSTDPSESPNTVSPWQNPSTAMPTSFPSQFCSDWQMSVEFEASQYTASDDVLLNLCSESFEETISSDSEKCLQINVQVIQQMDKIGVMCNFTFNNDLYDTYFSNYNETKFTTDFISNSLSFASPNMTDILMLKVIAPQKLQETFISNSVPTQSTNKTVESLSSSNKKILDFQVIIYSTILSFIFIIVISTIYSKCIEINDFYSIGALVAVAIHFNDSLSDVLFCVDITLQPEYPSSQLSSILWSSIIFLIVPSLLTVYQLYKSINEWKRNDKLTQWLSNNLKLLYFISIITGSGFAAVELCTSNLFNLGYFDMPLSKAQVMKFQTKSIYSIVLVEVKLLYSIMIIIPSYYIYIYCFDTLSRMFRN